MMRERKNNKFGFKAILYVLFLYVLLQLIWWGTLLSRLNKEVFILKHENNKLKSGQFMDGTEAESLLEQKVYSRNVMFLGEGLVFTLILSFGIIRLLKVRNAETNLAMQQQNFILSVTHELKSPLASAKLQIETLLKLKTDPAVQSKLLNNALSDIERLNSLTDNILTAAQIENNNIPLNLELVNVSELLDSIVQKFQAKSDRKVVLDISTKIIHQVDVTYLNSIVNNLLENAQKYSEPPSKIDFHSRVENGKLIVSVADYGIGISDQDKELVFKKFYRVGNEETRKTKGTGLGLFILKQLVDKHGGTVRIEDNFPNGTKFIVVI
jgi:signal transduction histidine kinase